ncbi:hypothetical protein AEAC466_21490 [Asticcacaulis sp. AC466]|uniref:GumC family protein n=1 Tax=Asticcacaulis sp. AC466 TaxID=1282362 RepID=UPI0003C3B4D0|nr:polysaccharide biosynthesis tyrosine autokinase [Asticcacaulis sp. AC466]ESQ81406.1 hypothetical protein AEAC466_21490 [Asticcacaulis sp. AC466]
MTKTPTQISKRIDDDSFEIVLPTFDLRSLISDLRRFTRFFVGVFIVTFALILVPIATKTPLYTATSQVMLDPRTMNTMPSQDVLSGLPSDTTTIDTEVQVLQSTALAERVVDSLHLELDPEFNPYLGGTKYFGLVKTKPISQEGLSPIAKQRLHEAIVDSVKSRVSVSRLALTRIINISYTAKSPQKATRIANEWARLYLSQQLEAKFEATKEANNWLNSRLGELKVQVEAAETALQQYKIANNLINATGDNTLGQQQITTLDQQLATVKVDQAEADARLAVAKRQLASGSAGDDVGEALNSPVVGDLRSKRAAVSQSLADLQSRYGPLHPEVVKAKRQMADIDEQIDAEIKRIISNLEAQAQIQRQRTASLQSSVGQARGQLIGNNQAMVKLNELQRNADAVSTLYQSYLDRFKQTSAQQGIDRTDARIVSNATLPGGPSSPNIPLGVAFAFLCATGLATALVFLRRAFDSGLTTGRDVETLLGQPYLAGVSDLGSTLDKSTKTTPVAYVVDKPLSVFSEGFRNLRASLIYSRLGEEVKVIAVTSSLPGEGKTTTSMCLARTMAMSGQSVVLLDCDLRRRSINRMIGKEVTAGLLEVLAGSATLDEVLVADDVTNVKFLPLAESTYTPRDVFGSPLMDDLLATLRSRFDVIILDTAPVLPVVDTRILCRKADVVAMLVRWRKTPRKAVQNSLGLLTDVGAQVSGVVLTQINVKEQSKYGYGDSGYYYKEYKKYYTQ